MFPFRAVMCLLARCSPGCIAPTGLPRCPDIGDQGSRGADAVRFVRIPAPGQMSWQRILAVDDSESKSATNVAVSLIIRSKTSVNRILGFPILQSYNLKIIASNHSRGDSTDFRWGDLFNPTRHSSRCGEIRQNHEYKALTKLWCNRLLRSS